MNRKLDNYIKIIQTGLLKNERVYYSESCSIQVGLPLELYLLLLNSFNNNYKVFYINCISNHNITISNKDINFLKSKLDKEYAFLNTDSDEFKKSEKFKIYNDYKNYAWDFNTLQIKNTQYKDILKLYNLSIESNNIGSLFIYPILDKNNKYCFNFFLTVTNNFDLNQLLNINFNLIKINSVIEYFSNTLSLDIIFNMYNVDNFFFNDYLIDHKSFFKTFNYDDNWEESINYIAFSQSYRKYRVDHSIDKELILEKQENNLSSLLSKKKEEAIDRETQKKIYFSKLCNHFYFFHEKLYDNSDFWCDYNDNLLLLNKDVIEADFDGFAFWPYSVRDLFYCNIDSIKSVYVNVCDWEKK